MSPTREFALKRSVYPYSVYIISCIALVSLGILVWFKRHDLSVFEAAIIVSLGFVATSYGDTRYQVFWRDGEIKQISANKDITIIKALEITSVGQEKSNLQERLSLRRPLDRIAVYAGHGSEEKHIDVSIRHFVNEDVRKLMQLIHKTRPDLDVPKNWL
jgi:hypothetical protein